MNETTKRIWISFEIPIFVEITLKEIAASNEIDLLKIISDIIYQKTKIEIDASDIRIKKDKHNQFLNYISLEIQKNKAIELTNKGKERNRSRQKLILEICEEFIKERINIAKN